MTENNADRYQVDFLRQDGQQVAPGGEAVATTRLFAGAKEVNLLDRYEKQLAVAQPGQGGGLRLVLFPDQADLLRAGLAVST